MAGVQRLGDPNILGGLIVSGFDTSVLVNGRPIAVPNGRITPHFPCGVPNCPPCQRHCTATTKKGFSGVGSAVGSFAGAAGSAAGSAAGGLVGGGSGVFVSGKPIIVNGDMDSCICLRIGGSFDVFIG